MDINVQEECKGSRGYNICDRIGRSILGGYQCAGGGGRGYIICSRMPETEDV